MPDPKQFYLDIRTSVPGQEKVREKYLEEHRGYLRQLKAEGKIFMAGRYKDGSGALIIYSVGSQEEAQALAAGDIFTKVGVYQSTVKDWPVLIS